jgi:hypothetical protein
MPDDVPAQSSVADPEQDGGDPGSMMVFRGKDGDWRWMAVHSNKFEDRTKEIFPESAHRAYVDEVWETKQFPSLRIWHIPVDIGRADFVDYDDSGFVVSSGKFYDPAVAVKLSGMKGLGCSHGYLYRKSDLQDGVYSRYRTYEVSVLPRERAANTLTAFFAGEEVPMLTPDRKEFLTALVGEEKAAQIEEGVRALTAVATERGLSYKSLEERLLDQRTVDQRTVDQRKADDGDGDEGGNPFAKDERPAAEGETEKCPECGAEVKDMEAHMSDKHAAKDDTAAPVVEPIVESVADPVISTSNAAAVTTTVNVTATPSAVTESGSANEETVVADDEHTPPSEFETPSEEDIAIAEEAAAAVADAKAAAEEGQNTDVIAVVKSAVETVIHEQVMPLVNDMRFLVERQKAMEAEIEGLKSSREDDIASRIRPRVGPISGGHRPSGAADNVVPAAQARKIVEASGVKDEVADNGTGSVYANPYVKDILGRLQGSFRG